ncbi:MAG: trimeric intracellular cation channel family protein [Pseudomonadota bacterium]
MDISSDLVLLFADRLGVFVFALSGGIVGVRNDMDLFGCIVLAFLPAVGGGTLRDILLDIPVFWLSDGASLACVLAGGVSAFVLHKHVVRFRPLRWVDAAGMALFAATGAAKTADLNHSFVIMAIMGTVTATAGGLLRDVVANNTPLLLKEDIYATAALLGACVFALFHVLSLSQDAAFIASFSAAFLLRAVAIVYGLSLPRPRR